MHGPAQWDSMKFDEVSIEIDWVELSRMNASDEAAKEMNKMQQCGQNETSYITRDSWRFELLIWVGLSAVCARPV